MTTDEAIAAIPTGWRFYTCDASIAGRWSVMLRHDGLVGDYVSATGANLTAAIAAASDKADWRYRGWNIAPDYLGYSATHQNYDCDCDEDGFHGNGLHVHGMTVEDVKAQIDDKIEDMQDAN